MQGGKTQHKITYACVHYMLFFFFPFLGYVIVHFIHFQLALLLVYGLVLPIEHGHVLSMLTNLGIIV